MRWGRGKEPEDFGLGRADKLPRQPLLFPLRGTLGAPYGIPGNGKPPTACTGCFSLCARLTPRETPAGGLSLCSPWCQAALALAQISNAPSRAAERKNPLACDTLLFLQVQVTASPCPPSRAPKASPKGLPRALPRAPPRCPPAPPPPAAAAAATPAAAAPAAGAAGAAARARAAAGTRAAAAPYPAAAAASPGCAAGSAGAGAGAGAAEAAVRGLSAPPTPRARAAAAAAEALEAATRQSESGPPPGLPPRLRLLSLCWNSGLGHPLVPGPHQAHTAPGCPETHPVLSPAKLPDRVIFLPGNLRATVDSTVCMDIALYCLHRLAHSRCSINAY